MTGEAATVSPVGADQLVVFDGVQKSYDGETLVVRDLNLAVRRGEFLTLLGPSGSGKTTTLMMLAGFERPTAGHIRLEGKPVEALPPEKRDIGFVFQNYALFPHMSVAENVSFPLRYRGVRGAEARERVARALAMVRLEGFDSRRPTQLSGGQQQRVALARALVFQPKLVLMDEPLGALDKQLRERMQIEIKHLQQTLGITIVFVTHDQSEALTMSDRVAVFHDGALQQLATPRDLYDEPGNAFVAGFVGENNLFPATVGSDGNRPCAVVNGLRVPGVLPRPLASGAAAVLAIRPERIGLVPAGTAGAVPCIVTEAFFLGDHARVEADVAGFNGASVTIKLPPSTAVPAPGTPAALDLPAAQCRIIAP